MCFIVFFLCFLQDLRGQVKGGNLGKGVVFKMWEGFFELIIGDWLKVFDQIVGSYCDIDVFF